MEAPGGKARHHLLARELGAVEEEQKNDGQGRQRSGNGCDRAARGQEGRQQHGADEVEQKGIRNETAQHRSGLSEREWRSRPELAQEPAHR